jgi:hypothetical protein
VPLHGEFSTKGKEPNAITIKDPEKFKIKNGKEESALLSNNPELDFTFENSQFCYRRF